MSRKYKDPFSKREAQKYKFPIPSREYILEYLGELGCPASLSKLIEDFGLVREEEEDGLRFRLRAMVRDGQLMRDRRGRYCLMYKLQLIPGTVIAHPDGFGFLKPDDGSDDLFLSAREMEQVFHGDRVLVRESGIDRRGRREAVILEVIERNTHQIVGRFCQEQSISFVEPEHKRFTQDIYIPHDQCGKAQPGQIVVVEIILQPSRHAQAIGRVMEVLGDHMAPGMEIDVAIRSYEIPREWLPEVVREVKKLKPKLIKKDYQNRADIRHLPLVTIDGEDAKDFDDAVYCEARPKGGWNLYVAIADVSYYVKQGTALDTEAISRGNSVYFPGRVIPMLPEILSNELCSLNPEVDRLSMVCEMVVSPSGKLMRYRFYQAVMYSHARLTYTQVATILQNSKSSLRKTFKSVLPHLLELHEMFKVLYQARQDRGAIEFDSKETRIIFGKDKKIEKVEPVVRNDAHRIIEECMLLANVAAAKFLQKNKIPSLYRVHQSPSEEKIAGLREFLRELGLTLQGGENPRAQDYREIIENTRDRVDAHLIQTVMLRSMAQAEYQEKNIGHFALAYPAYTHFTSPIRRYPDLLVHRAISYVLSHQDISEFPYSEEAMQKMGLHCSQTERRADEATRDVVAWLKCEYMMDKVGQEFDGIITSVTNFGLFIELNEIYVEGLVHITALKSDYYQYDVVQHRLRGERTGTVYRLGDPIRVQVARVNLDEREIDFELI